MILDSLYIKLLLVVTVSVCQSLRVLVTTPSTSHKRGVIPFISALRNGNNTFTVFAIDFISTNVSETDITDMSVPLLYNHTFNVPLSSLFLLAPKSIIRAKVDGFTMVRFKRKVQRLLNKSYDVAIHDACPTAISLKAAMDLPIPYFIMAQFPPIGCFTREISGIRYNPSIYPSHLHVISDITNTFWVRTVRTAFYIPSRLYALSRRLLKSYVVTAQFNETLTVANFYALATSIVVVYPIEMDVVSPTTHLINHVPLQCKPEDYYLTVPLFLTSHYKGIIVISTGHTGKWTNYEVKQFALAIRHFPNYKFVWQRNFEGDYNLSSNVEVVPWVPDNLTSIALRITHGGMKTIRECLCTGVPMLVYPHNDYNDQPQNCLTIQNFGAGLCISKGQLHYLTIVRSIADLLLQRDSYRKRIVKLRGIMIDRPLTSVEIIRFYLNMSLKRSRQRRLLMDKSGKDNFVKLISMNHWLCCLLLYTFISCAMYIIVY